MPHLTDTFIRSLSYSGAFVSTHHLQTGYDIGLCHSISLFFTNFPVRRSESLQIRFLIELIFQLNNFIIGRKKHFSNKNEFSHIFFFF